MLYYIGYDKKLTNKNKHTKGTLKEVSFCMGKKEK